MVAGTDKFDEIFKEIKRQFGVLVQFDNSQDTKIGIFLGFTILAIVQLLTYEGLGKRFLATNLSIGFFLSSLFLIGYSFYAAIRAYFIKEYHIGPDLAPIINKYREGITIDFKKNIARGIFEAKKWNSSMMKEKVYYMRSMMISFVIGLGLITLSFLISLMKLEVILNVG